MNLPQTLPRRNNDLVLDGKPMARCSPGVVAANILYVSGVLAVDASGKKFFPRGFPARYCIRANLVEPELLVEIASIAHLPKDR
jgi:enamine deaminase RidA (YjgF/YER057c/UK114 family)